MPDLVGMTMAGAQNQLTKVGIQTPTPTFVTEPLAPVGAGDAPPRPPVRPGVIVAQWPAPGSRVFQNVTVTLKVSK
jgi:beta-lactam-binding protein with PASTA domain